jgi:ubiquinone/menaquinone biosynthesis C-methylase UbiE
MRDIFTLTREVHDLGHTEPRLAGIYAPHDVGDVVPQFIHAQFLERSEKYIAAYQNTAYWKELVSAALTRAALDRGAVTKILDIGSGAGNTIFPLLELFPTAQIVATDLSLPLLLAIGSQAAGSDRLTLLQMNAEDFVFEANQFDLVIGGAILHHLFDPAKTITESHRVLKPGGTALFFEPFELGNQMLSLILRQICERNARRLWRHVPLRALLFFYRLRRDLDRRKGEDKTAAVFKRVDDKWLFTRAYLERAATACGFPTVGISPLHGTDNMFQAQIRSYLRTRLGMSLERLPRWCHDLIRSYDDQFSESAKRELVIEGCITLAKPAAP